MGVYWLYVTEEILYSTQAKKDTEIQAKKDG